MTAPSEHAAVRVPATSANLGPGFDAMGVALSLYLTARTVDRGDVRVTTAGEGAGEVPHDDDNLVWRSFVAGCQDFGAAVPDVGVAVDNAIPLERGLGSSSAAIVAGLALARWFAPDPVADRRLVELANDLEGHPDNVAPAVLGGFVLAATSDAGDLVLRTRPPAGRYRPLALVPDGRQNTVEARGVVPEHLDRAEVAVQGARSAFVAGAMVGSWPAEAQLAGDRLHEPARLAVMTASGLLVEALRSRGITAWLSGAGPSVAVQVEVLDDQAHRIVADLAQGEGFSLVPLDWDLAGAVTCGAARCALAGMRGCVGCPWG